MFSAAAAAGLLLSPSLYVCSKMFGSELLLPDSEYIVCVSFSRKNNFFFLTPPPPPLIRRKLEEKMRCI